MNRLRCAIYTRKSSEEGLDQAFNSLDAQREACNAYIASQRHEGWVLLPERYDDAGISGGHLDRPALQRLMEAVDERRVDQIVVYKIDRLTRSLPDFARLVERLDAAGASFVSVTQSFNTATSMGRLTLNVLLSFAQFEREVTAERIRDKIAASKRKGLWMGGNEPLGYRATGRTLEIIPEEAETVRTLFDLYEQRGTLSAVASEVKRLGLRSKLRPERSGRLRGGSVLRRGQVHHVLTNPVYAGRIRHKERVYEGQHEAIIDPDRWERVQASLKDQSARPRGRQPASHPSPLAGKLFDESGDRLTPSHANKNGRRYRYYVSARLVSGDAEKGSGWRLPAVRLERDLARAVQAHLEQALNHGHLGANDLGAIQKAKGVLAGLGNESLSLIDNAQLGIGSLHVELNPDALGARVAINRASLDPRVLTFALPFAHRRRGVEGRLVLGNANPERDDILIANIARAICWRECVAAGQSLEEIAARSGQTAKYVGQMLVFGLLSPRLVRQVLAGTQPPALTTNWLRRHGLPACWDDQERIVACL
jgi:DNA invertase Pin-like site-specific DNA recombinase